MKDVTLAYEVTLTRESRSQWPWTAMAFLAGDANSKGEDAVATGYGDTPDAALMDLAGDMGLRGVA